MAHSGYWEAVQLYHDALQSAISRVTTAILLRRGPLPPGEGVGHLYLSEVRPLFGGSAINRAFSLEIRFRVVPTIGGEDRWDVQTFAYSYLLFRDDQEEVAYHWNDEADDAVAIRAPHAHFGKDLAHAGLPRKDRDRIGALAAAHLPTGLVPFTAILRTAIRDFGAEPLRRQNESEMDARSNAARSFEKAEAALIQSFAWRTPPASGSD
ncbi:MAG: hypothetical protein ACR2OO_00345 [Thermomicrobiales bacterium]